MECTEVIAVLARSEAEPARFTLARIILEMTVSITELSARCFEIIRVVERERKVVEITRRGDVVARLLPTETDLRADLKPWERLPGSGTLLGPPEQSVLKELD